MSKHLMCLSFNLYKGLHLGDYKLIKLKVDENKKTYSYKILMTFKHINDDIDYDEISALVSNYLSGKRMNVHNLFSYYEFIIDNIKVSGMNDNIITFYALCKTKKINIKFDIK